MVLSIFFKSFILLLEEVADVCQWWNGCRYVWWLNQVRLLLLSEQYAALKVCHYSVYQKEDTVVITPGETLSTTSFFLCFLFFFLLNEMNQIALS